MAEDAINAVADKPTGLRILIVEDNADCALTTAMLLRTDGHDVKIAKNATEGIAVARAVCPNVVILDIGLPGTSGYEVAKQLRSLTSGPVPILIAATGYADEDHRRYSAEAGIDQHLVKPIDMRDLMAQLRELQSAMRSRPDRNRAPNASGVKETTLAGHDETRGLLASIQDAELELKVTNYLRLRLPGLNAVTVEAQRGTLTLSGTVPSPSMQRQCVDCCCDVAGVHSVMDRLVVSADND